MQYDKQRRDPRYTLRDDGASVELGDPGDASEPMGGPLVKLSATGLCFEAFGWGHDLAPGDVLGRATLHVGDCALQGDVIVKNVCAREGAAVVGGVFHPASPEIEDTLMALISGIEAVAGRAEATK